MKKLLILLSVILTFSSSYSQCTYKSPDVLVRSDNEDDGSDPYSWTAGLYSVSQVGGGGIITSITFRLDTRTSSSSETYNNQYIYMHNTSTTDYTSSSSYPNNSGFTLVWSGTITFDHLGYYNITLDAPFSYNGTDNLEVLYENQSNNSSYNEFWFDRTDASSSYKNGKIGSGYSWNNAKSHCSTQSFNTAFGFNTINTVDCRNFETTLPIVLSKFDAYKNNENVNLEWTTSSEINNNYFTVEHSVDGVNFNSIGRIKGAGNSNSRINYSFIDKNPITKINYYRLKQTDFDGEYSYSETKSINFNNNEINSFKVFPNPANSSLQIETVNNNSNIKIIDISGRTIIDIHSQKSNNKINISELNKGIYFVKLTTNNNTQIIKFIKD